MSFFDFSSSLIASESTFDLFIPFSFGSMPPKRGHHRVGLLQKKIKKRFSKNRFS
jgi:hypothetical protein